MPSVLIEVRRQYTQEQEVALMEAVHMALCEAFEVVRQAVTLSWVSKLRYSLRSNITVERDASPQSGLNVECISEDMYD